MDLNKKKNMIDYDRIDDKSYESPGKRMETEDSDQVQHLDLDIDKKPKARPSWSWTNTSATGSRRTSGGVTGGSGAPSAPPLSTSSQSSTQAPNDISGRGKVGEHRGPAGQETVPKNVRFKI